jgi:hypothetical protein
VPALSIAISVFLSGVRARSATAFVKSGQFPPTRSFVVRSHTHRPPPSSPETASVPSAESVAQVMSRPFSFTTVSAAPSGPKTSNPVCFSPLRVHTTAALPSAVTLMLNAFPVAAVRTSFAGLTVHQRTRPSSPAAITSLGPAKPTAFTGSVAPVSVATSLPAVKSHTFTVRSSAPVAT